MAKATRRIPRERVLLALMAVFTLGNLACALASDYATLMAARVLTSLAHGTFFGVGSVVARGLVPADKQASAIATMCTGLTAATLLGVPAGAWISLHAGWRASCRATRRRLPCRCCARNSRCWHGRRSGWAWR